MNHRRSGSYMDYAAELDAHYGDGYPEKFPQPVAVGTRVYGRLGTDAEVGGWGAGTIESINEARTEARVRWPNQQVRLMYACDVMVEDKP